MTGHILHSSLTEATLLQGSKGIVDHESIVICLATHWQLTHVRRHQPGCSLMQHASTG